MLRGDYYLYLKFHFVEAMPSETPLEIALNKLPDTPACFKAPWTSPSVILRIVLVVTEKSPLVGLAVCAPITL